MRSREQDQTGYRTVSGFVSAAGAPTGAGFTASKIATADYMIRFTPPFRAAPDLTATQDGTTGYARYFPGGPDRVEIGTYNTAGAATDSAFHFVARGLA
jgi:hypothetical protein